jgi:peptidoglycan L-alanyl-D-glutamate endopeptidase CwlK
MPNFSDRSQEILGTCDDRLQEIFYHVINDFDCTILEGARSKERQNELFRAGKSKLEWPLGKHNSDPSLAVDVVPYPIDWKDRERMTYFAGYVRGIAQSLGYVVRWGGDWDMDWEVRDNNFDDLVHFELREI